MGKATQEAPSRLPLKTPFARDCVHDREAVRRRAQRFILSASGWRAVFGTDEQDARPELTATDREIVALAGFTYADFLREKAASENLEVALATDTRPTGPAIAAVLARALLSCGIKVRFLGISAAPEIMAYVKRIALDGFVYVTASHNPIGHNGLKFGLSDGGVIGASDAAVLISSFHKLLGDDAKSDSVIRSAAVVEESALQELNRVADRWKKEALDAYLSFTLEVGTMSSDVHEQGRAIDPIRAAARGRKIGVVADFNGSARSVSIDRAFLERLGVRFQAINDVPGRIVHAIVPEGESLEPCRRELTEAHARDPGVLIGYVPDNDGDRGNLVYVDPRTGKTEILRAQEVFALSCMAELAYLVHSGRLAYSSSGKAQQRHAVVVNGPTSLRIDAIAKAFDVQVFRAEVGEANVVNLARDSRNSGFQVRLMGEGSNGGNITHPACVRDPLNTLFAFLKLLLIGSAPGRPGLYEIWCDRCGLSFDPDAGIREMLDSLPHYVTTDVNEPRARVDIRSSDHARLKEAYEEIFRREWDEKRDELAGRLGVHTWEEINYEGTNEIHGFGKSYRSGKQRGGLKILFKDDSGGKVGFIWMRGSGTEPVFRVLADVNGDDPSDEKWLLDWHVSMILRADSMVAGAIGAHE